MKSGQDADAQHASDSSFSSSLEAHQEVHQETNPEANPEVHQGVSEQYQALYDDFYVHQDPNWRAIGADQKYAYFWSAPIALQFGS